MTNTHSQEPEALRTRSTNIQHWTNTPEVCPTCGDSTVSVVEIDGELLCQQLDIPFSESSVHRISNHTKANTSLPSWALKKDPLEHYEGGPPSLLVIPGPLNCVHLPSIARSSDIAGLKGDVHIDGVRLLPDRSRQVQNHSPDGFSWGYQGSGPAQLALALLLEAGASQKEAQKYHQEFKRDKIAMLPNFAFHMKGSVVLDWLTGCRAAARIFHS